MDIKHTNLVQNWLKQSFLDVSVNEEQHYPKCTINNQQLFYFLKFIMLTSTINQLYVKLGISPLSEMIMVLSGSKKKYPIYIPRVCGTKTRKN